jgi:hypothetical protein
MGVYDQAARFAARMCPEAVLPNLLGVGYSGRQIGWFNTRSIPMPGGADREADLVPELEGDEGRVLLVLEFQSEHDDDKLDVSLLEAATLRVYARHGEGNSEKYRVFAALIYLKGECPQSVLDMTLPYRGGTHHRALVWDVCKNDARISLDKLEAGRVSWGVLFWLPLMKGGCDADVLARWKALAERLAPTPEALVGLRGCGRVFADLVGKRPEWERAMGVSLVTESEVVNEWMAMKALEEAKIILRELIRERFPGLLTADVEAAIADQPSHDLLRSWLRALARPDQTAEGFLAVLRQ